MSVKYLVDFLGAQGWSKNTDDIFRAGQLLAEVLPHFGSEPGDLAMPTQPFPPVAQANGQPDWSRMTVDAANAFRAAVDQYQRDLNAWARAPIAKDIVLTDKQLIVCQSAVKYFAPRSAEDKEKDAAKGTQPRAELPANEFSFRLLGAIGLAAD